MCFSSSENCERLIFLSKTNTPSQSRNPCALFHYPVGFSQRQEGVTFDLELVHKTRKLFNATDFNVCVETEKNHWCSALPVLIREHTQIDLTLD